MKKRFTTKYRKQEHQNCRNSDYHRIIKLFLPISPLKFIFLKRGPSSGEKRMVIFGGENEISRPEPRIFQNFIFAKNMIYYVNI